MIQSKPECVGRTTRLHIPNIINTTNMFKKAEWIHKIRKAIYRYWYITTIFKRYFVTTRLNGNIRLKILDSEQKLWHADTHSMLTNLAHIIKVEFEYTLQFKFILKVVYETCGITYSGLLMYSTTYQILVDIILQSDRSDVIDGIQRLLNLRLLFLWLNFLVILFLFYKHLSQQTSKAKIIIIIYSIIIYLILQNYK